MKARYIATDKKLAGDLKMQTEEILSQYRNRLQTVYEQLPVGYEAIGFLRKLQRTGKGIIITMQEYARTGWQDADVHPHTTTIVYDASSRGVTINGKALLDYSTSASPEEIAIVVEARKFAETTAQEETVKKQKLEQLIL